MAKKGFEVKAPVRTFLPKKVFLPQFSLPLVRNYKKNYFNIR